MIFGKWMLPIINNLVSSNLFMLLLILFHFMVATALSGENIHNCIIHCLNCFSVLGIPKQIKTDNAPAYTSLGFKKFCAAFHIELKTGIPIIRKDKT